MNDKHIDFSNLERGDSVDREHLIACRECRDQHGVWRLIRDQAGQAPTIEAPPFFASRVARLAVSESESGQPAFFLLTFERAARQLLPVFMALILVVCFLGYQSRPARMEPALTDEELAFLVDDLPDSDAVAFEDLFAGGGDEGVSGDEPQ